MNNPRRSLWRSRCLACVGALFVIVLLTAVGMPSQSAGWMSSGWMASNWIAQPRNANRHVARGEERLARSPHLEALPLRFAECLREAQALHLPRVMPRTRSTSERGLPPPRAPCA